MKEKILGCPYTAFKKKCIREECPKWTKLIMQNPQTGENIDQWACSDTWVPILLTEISRKLIQVDATMESHRNEASRTTQQLTDMIGKAENANIKVNQHILQKMEAIQIEAAKAAAYQLGKAENKALEG